MPVSIVKFDKRSIRKKKAGNVEKEQVETTEK